MEEASQRLLALKSDLIARIPCTPEETKLKNELSQKSLSSVIAHYITWIDRLIPPRPRHVTFSEVFWKRTISNNQIGQIASLCEKVAAGDDLTPYLSRYTQTHGYTGDITAVRKAPLWADGGKGDKDFAIHVYETHHLHLVPMNGNSKRKGQSDDLIFININRNEMRFLMLGTHKSFDSVELREVVANTRKQDGLYVRGISPRPPLAANPHKSRRQGLNTVEIVDGKAVIMGLMSCGGSGLLYTQYPSTIMRFLEEWEGKLDTETGRTEFAARAEVPLTFLDGFRWGFWFGDFCLISSEEKAVRVLYWHR